jgi:hypothetical protein
MPVYREWDTCPHCHKRLSDVRMGVASGTTIGPALATCPHCKGVYKTGKSEWADKSKAGRVGYYIQIARWCVGTALAMAALCVVVALLIMGFVLEFSANQMVWGGVIVAVVVAIIAVAIILDSSRREIKESLERTRKARLGDSVES